jgi:protein ImuB
MLWIALHFPNLPLESFPQASAQSEPWAVTDGPGVAVCNTQARARGVRRGMSLSSACALAPDLNYRARDLKAEAAALEQIAAWAGQFTPSVSLQPPNGLLLEIEGSLRLLGGIRKILESIRRGAADMGYTLTLACAPTVGAAWLLARAGSETIVTGKRAIEAAIAPLPVTALDCSARTLETLAAIGARSIGDLLRLPRDGLARRCGERLLVELDRALGARPEARVFYSPPPRFEATLELGAAVANTEALLFAVRRLLTQLTGYLAARCRGVQRFNLVLMHEEHADTLLEIGLVTPTREAARLVTLVRERLSAHALAAPVHRIGLQADDILALADDSGHLFPDHANTTGDWEKLIERLCARLGADAVQGLSPRSEHRPECAWQAAPPGAQAAQATHPPRPLWLLQPPRALREVASKPYYHNGPLALIAGPERIESGWWDGNDVKRDYFVAQTPDRSTLWIYRERRQPGGWYLHGIFG